MLPALIFLPGPGFYPYRPLWKINSSRDRALFCHRGDKKIRAQHEFICQVGSGKVGGEVEIKWTHGRCAVGVSRPVEVAQVRFQVLAQEEQAADNLVGTLTE
jgi:hypothetical protein